MRVICACERLCVLYAYDTAKTTDVHWDFTVCPV